MRVGNTLTIGGMSSVGAGIIDPDAQIFIDRVIADGGTVEDPAFLNSFFLDAKANNYFSDLGAAYCPSWGRKGAGTISDLYSTTGAAEDWQQVVAASQMAINLADLNGKTRITGDGIDDFMTPWLGVFTQPATFMFGGYQSVSFQSQSIIATGSTSALAVKQGFSSVNQLRLNAPTSAAFNLDAVIGGDFTVRTLFNGASSKIQVDANAESTGDAGANNPGGFGLANTTLPSNSKYGMVVALDAAVDGSYAAKVTALYNFMKSAYGTA